MQIRWWSSFHPNEDRTATVANMRKKIAISFLIGVVLSAGALYIAFRRVPIAELGKYLAAINYLWTMPALVLVILTLMMRAYRWRYLLAPGHQITVRGAFSPMMIGFMINCVLPGRLGEIARPMALKQTKGIPFGTGFATVAAERLFDLILAAALFLIMINIVEIDPKITISFGDYQMNKLLLESLFGKTVFITFILFCGLVLVSVGRTRQAVINIVQALPRLLANMAPRLADIMSRYFSRPVSGLLETVASGLGLLRSPQKMLICLLLTVAVWGLQLLSFVVLAWGFPEIDLTVFEMSAMMVIVLFFIALPSVPGWWGVWEAGGIFALALFGVPRLEAAGFTLISHALQVLPVILIGIGCAMISSINIWQVARTDVETGSPGVTAVSKRIAE